MAARSRLSLELPHERLELKQLRLGALSAELRTERLAQPEPAHSQPVVTRRP